MKPSAVCRALRTLLVEERQPVFIWGIFSISGGTGTVGRELIKIEFFLFRFPGAAKVRLVERNISLAVRSSG